MVYLLIDTCSLLQLVDKNGYNTYISELQNHINNDRIRLITHKIVLEEWNKHKIKQQHDKERSLMYIGNQQKSDDYYDAIPNAINTIEHIDLQTKQIDEILSKAHQLNSVPEAIKNETGDRIAEKLAPFSRKADSINDWYIIGSLCTYCQNNQIKEIHFISKNFNDFGDSSKLSIHPSLQERFNKVIIKYYPDYSKFFNILIDDSESTYSSILFTIPTNEKYKYNATIRKNVLESIHYIYDSLYSEIEFVPLHILTKYHPFNGSPQKSYYESFTLYNLNKTTVSFFENIIIENSNLSFKDESFLREIKDYKLKTEFILARLTRNLIYWIKNSEKDDSTSTYYKVEGECDCCRCNYNNFRFYDTFNGLKINLDTVEDKLKAAYINYKLGNLKISYNLYIDISQRAYKEKKFIIYFIAKYNLSHLSKFLNNYFFNRNMDSDVIDELKKIDPIEEAVKLKPHTDYNLLLFIAQEDFFTESFQNIKSSVNSIIEHYDAQLDGGWSSENHVWKLSEEFAKTEYFINKNFIIYDRYLNFENMFQMVTEGLFCALATSKKSGGNLEKLDIYWIHKIIIYGKRKYIIKYYKKYNLKCLPIEIDGQNYFINSCKNFFDNQNYKSEIDLQIEELDNGYYQQMYISMFETFITIASVLSMNKANTSLFAEMLLSFMKSKGVRSSDIKLIVDFIKSKRNNIDTKVLLDYFNYYFDELEKDSLSFASAIIDSFKKRDYLIMENVKVIELVDKIFNLMKESKNDYYEIIANMYKKVNKDVKKYIRDKIKDTMLVDSSFDLFYLSTIFNIVPLDKEKLLSALDELKLEATDSWRSIFSGVEEFRIYQLDELLNVLFKFNIYLDDTRMYRIKQVHPYYRWVIDPDNFNYKEFDLNWIVTYPTIYYFKRMAKSEKLIQLLLKKDKSQNNIRISKAIVRIVSLR